MKEHGLAQFKWIPDSTRRVLLLFSCLWGVGCFRASEPTGNLNPTTNLAASPELLALGKSSFEKNCAPCHGLQGDGKGPVADRIFPKPRNFVRANYRIVSTWDYQPTDEDIFRTISRGMPGSVMPSWAHLPQKTRWALVHYVKSFARMPFEFGPDHQPKDITDQPSGMIVIPPEPPYTEQAQAHAKQLYSINCASCHGVTAKGDGAQKQEDSEGFPTRPRDLTAGLFKGSPEPREVYKRLMGGLPGSPMPSHPHLYGNDGWDLVHFVRSLSSEEQRQRVEAKHQQIIATRVTQLPAKPEDPLWDSTPAVELSLLPLWWHDQRPEILTVRALHDGNEIAIQLGWTDAAGQNGTTPTQILPASAAIQFALSAKEQPFLVMGDNTVGGQVNLWMWKPGADGQDSASDWTARGFDTLTELSQDSVGLSATTRHEAEAYRVIFRRLLKSKESSRVTFEPGANIPVAFVVWDSGAEDREKAESMTIWQDLRIAP